MQVILKTTPNVLQYTGTGCVGSYVGFSKIIIKNTNKRLAFHNQQLHFSDNPADEEAFMFIIPFGNTPCDYVKRYNPNENIICSSNSWDFW